MNQNWAKCAICSAVCLRERLVEPPLPFRAPWESVTHPVGALCCPDHRIELVDDTRVLGPVEASGAVAFLAGGVT